MHSALGYRSPEEFEQQAKQETAVTIVGATVTFFPKSEGRASTEITGEGTQGPSLSPDPIPAGESSRWDLRKSSVVNCGTGFCLT